jgi:hypothetical protein
MAVLFVADELLQMARKACERSRTYPPEAIAAIVLSVIGFEAFLNEMVELSSGPPHKRPRLMSKFRSPTTSSRDRG